MIHFQCKSCGQKINVQEKFSGKKGKCPKCKNIVVIPELEGGISPASQSGSGDVKVKSEDSPYDLTLLDVPEKDRIKIQPEAEAVTSDKHFEKIYGYKASDETDEAETAGRRKLPWIIDIFLYPISFWGMINIVIFVGVPELIDFLQKIILVQLACLFSLITLFIEIVVVLYMYWYFAECVRDSADGGLRAPKVIGDVPSVVDMFWQMVNIVGCLIFFFIPFVCYVLFFRKAGVIFWLLLIYGVFFFPMALLAIIVLDSVSGLNPRLLISSISNTFFQYCGLVSLFTAAVLLFGVLGQKCDESEHLAFIFRCAGVYLVFVAAHLLGRFYWRNKDKLDWGL